MQNRVFIYKWKKYKKCRNCKVTREVSEYKSNWYSYNWNKRYKPLCRYCDNLIQRNSVILKTDIYKHNLEVRRLYVDKNREKFNKANREYYHKKKNNGKKN